MENNFINLVVGFITFVVLNAMCICGLCYYGGKREEKNILLKIIITSFVATTGEFVLYLLFNRFGGLN